MCVSLKNSISRILDSYRTVSNFSVSSKSFELYTQIKQKQCRRPSIFYVLLRLLVLTILMKTTYKNKLKLIQGITGNISSAQNTSIKSKVKSKCETFNCGELPLFCFTFQWFIVKHEKWKFIVHLLLEVSYAFS